MAATKSEFQKKLYKDISNCRECELCRASDPREHQFTLYGSNSVDPRYMFIMQNPAKISEEEKRKLNAAKNTEEKVKINREYLIRWLLEKNKKFCERFFQVLKEKSLIKTSISYEEYFGKKDDKFDTYNSPFLQDFYVTDVIKCRAETEDIPNFNKDISRPWQICYSKFLKDEIDKFTGNLIFIFSTRSWQTIANELKPQTIANELKPNPKTYESGVARVHGQLLKKNFGHKIVYLIPMIHFSGQGISNCPQDSYWCYLEVGIKAYLDITKK